MLTRIITGVLLIGVLVFALAMGGFVFAVLCMAAICLAEYEMYHALAQKGHRPVQWPAWICTAASVPCFLYYSNAVLLPLVSGACLIIIFVVLFRRDPKLEDALMSVMPIFCVVLPGMCLLGFLKVQPRAMSIALHCMAFLVPLMGDTAAYFIGSRIGKTKLIPAVSPNKTVAGAVAGLIGSTVTAVIIYFAASMFTQMPPVWHFILLGLGGGFAGQVGDLYASLVKRHCGIKDFSNIFPGHGGMMDRLDSVFFTTVLIYIYQSMMGLSAV